MVRCDCCFKEAQTSVFQILDDKSKIKLEVCYDHAAMIDELNAQIQRSQPQVRVKSGLFNPPDEDPNLFHLK